MLFDLTSYLDNINSKIILTNNINQYINNYTVYKVEKDYYSILLEKENIILTINVDSLTSDKKLQKLIKKIIKFNYSTFSRIKTINYIINLNNKELTKISIELNNRIFNLIHSINAISFKTKKEKYEYLYDIICEYLDKSFTENNLCDFKDGKCIANRTGKTIHKDNGCCYNIKYIGHLNFKNCGYCTKLSKTGCTIKCISCKLFTCKYHKKQGVYFNPKKIFLINTFFNSSEILVLQYNIYRTKEEIINKLINTKLLPYFLALITKSYYIKESD